MNVIRDTFLNVSRAKESAVIWLLRVSLFIERFMAPVLTNRCFFCAKYKETK